MDLTTLFNEIFERSEIKGEEIKSILNEENIRKFLKQVPAERIIRHNFAQNANTYNLRLFSQLTFLWEAITIEDIEKILIDFDEDKNYDGLINLISFFGKYLNLDLLNFYLELELIGKNMEYVFHHLDDGFLSLIYMLKIQKSEIDNIEAAKELEKASLRFAQKGVPKLPHYREYVVKINNQDINLWSLRQIEAPAEKKSCKNWLLSFFNKGR